MLLGQNQLAAAGLLQAVFLISMFDYQMPIALEQLRAVDAW